MAAIAMYMLLIAMVGGFGAINGRFGTFRYPVLLCCTLVMVGVFGFLRLRRWGWALITGAAVSLSLYILYVSKLTHQPSLWVMAGLNLCIFLYLVRTEVRERLRA